MPIETFGDGALHALCQPYSLSGRVSTHPAGSIGYACMNCYVLRNGRHALLLDTGMSVHQDAVLSDLDRVLASDAVLAVLPFRFGEFNALCNARPIAEGFNVRTFYMRGFGEPAEWLNFRPGFDRSGGGLADLPASALVTGDSVSVVPDGHARLHILSPPLRLLPGLWAYDQQTKTLFTSDLFTWIWRSDPSGPWTATIEHDQTDPDQIRRCLTQNRYWWLAGARTERLRRDLAAVFDRFDIDMIAPAYGAILVGSQIVQRHVAMLDDLLARLASEPSTGVSASGLPASEVA